MKVFFYSAHSYDRDAFEAVTKPPGYEFTYHAASLEVANAPIAAGSDAICIFVNDDCSAQVIEALHEHGIKVILLRCAGFNNVDLAAAKKYGMFVARVPAYSPEAIAEHAMALILTLNRKTHRAFNRVRENNFALTGLLGHTLHGKTAGVVGTGKIGVCMVRILLGFGMKVLAYDIIHNPEVEQLGVTYCNDLHELLSQSHIVSLHAPLLESTKYMINSESIKSMRPGSLLVNTSRGGLVEHKAIIEALKKKQIGGLAIDVYENEEGLFFKNHEGEIMEDDVIARLMSFPNVLVTGHQAFFTVESLREIASITVNNLTCWDEGKECKNVVS